MPNKTISRLLFVMTVVFVFFCPFAAIAQGEGLKIKTVVIDAGHGGHDPGAISADKKLKEKEVTLDIALALGAKIKEAYPHINVIYTRRTDVYVPLDRRSDIANKNHADLFISVHCNSVGKGKAAPSGCETFVMGANKSDSNMEVCKIENSVILLEDDYSAKYQGFDPNDPESFIFFNLMQNAYLEQSIIMADFCQKHLSRGPIPKNRGIKQGGLLVLWRTTMPSVLVEVGFITNQSDRNVLASKGNRSQLAARLFSAFSDFKNQYESSVEKSFSEENEQKNIVEETCYVIQIFSLSRELPVNSKEFKGENVFAIKTGNTYKYFSGRYGSAEEAKKALSGTRKKFKDAFVTKIKTSEIVTLKQ